MYNENSLTIIEAVLFKQEFLNKKKNILPFVSRELEKFIDTLNLVVKHLNCSKNHNPFRSSFIHKNHKVTLHV